MAGSVLVKTLRVLGKTWIGLGMAVILSMYAVTLYMRGFWALQEMLSPFNVSNIIAVAITLAPGFLMLMAADGFARGQRKAALTQLALVPVALTVIVVVLLLFQYARKSNAVATEDERTGEYTAVSVRVKNRSATMLEHRNYGITKTSGPVGSDGIPDRITLGDVVSVSGRRIKVQHIYVTEIHKDMKFGGQFLARKGDVTCVLVENKQDRPEDDGRDRRWIYVKQCEPLERQK